MTPPSCFENSLQSKRFGRRSPNLLVAPTESDRVTGEPAGMGLRLRTTRSERTQLGKPDIIVKKEELDLTFEGRLHSGLADARAIAKIIGKMLMGTA